MNDFDYRRKVHTVFDVRPRNGNANSNLYWFPRKEIEEELQNYVRVPGVSICIDGPYGTGKSSLATTILAREKIDYSIVETRKDSSLKDICKELFDMKTDGENSFQAELLGGLSLSDTGMVLPKIEAKIGFDKNKSELRNIELKEKIINLCDESDICRWISKNNKVLIIDNFEKASDTLIVKVADMCKALTQTYSSENGKLIIIGAGNFFQKIYHADHALHSRLVEISVHGLAGKNESWGFLQRGIEKVGKNHPGNNRYSEPGDSEECGKEIYRSANGLLKGLIHLGNEICLQHNPYTKSISKATIINTSRKYPKNRYREFHLEFPGIKKFINNPITRDVLKYIYNNGVSGIHSVEEITDRLSKEKSYRIIDLEDALQEMVKSNFLVKTGIGDENIFVTEPLIAQVFGVLQSYPKEYEAPEEFLNQVYQQKLFKLIDY